MDLLALAFNITTVQDWIEWGGYFVLFGLLFACGLGLPLPEDIPLIIAGAFVAADKMDLAIASTVAWCGIIGGDVVLYHLGKKLGLNVTKVPFVGKHLTRQRIEKVESLFEKYGIWVVAVGRMFAGIRGAMVVAAGTIRYSFWKFVIADGIAAIVSGGFFVALGYWLGQNLPKLMKDVDSVKRWVTIAVILAVVAGVVWFIWRRKHPKQEPSDTADEVAKKNDAHSAETGEASTVGVAPKAPACAMAESRS